LCTKNVSDPIVMRSAGLPSSAGFSTAVVTGLPLTVSGSLARSVTFDPSNSSTPASAGASGGSTMSLSGPEPKEFLPWLRKKRPATVSQLLSPLRSASLSCRHWAISCS